MRSCGSAQYEGIVADVNLQEVIPVLGIRSRQITENLETIRLPD